MQCVVQYELSMIKILIGCLILVALCESRTSPRGEASRNKSTFGQAVNSPDLNRIKGCGCRIQGKGHIICSKINSTEEICLTNQNVNDLDAKSFSLVIKNANISVLDMTYGFFSKIGLENDLVSRLEKLRIVNTTLQHINICSLEKNEDQDLIKCESLSGLRSLDLRDNQLTGLREFRLESLVDLNLAGNRWSCFQEQDIEAIPEPLLLRNESASSYSLQPKSQVFRKATASSASMAGWFVRDFGKKVRDNTKTFCANPEFKAQKGNWHQKSPITNVTLLHFLNFNQNMEYKCPHYCRCSPANFYIPLRVKVSCEESSMMSLPEVLPENTVELNVSYNKITSLVPLRTNPYYKHLRRLIANGNEITSMSDLVGSPFVGNRPTTLDLRANRIAMFDLSVLRPIIEELKVGQPVIPPGFIQMFFNENPWSCDCDAVYEIQNFLYAYKSFLHDAEYLSCDDDRKTYLIRYPKHLCSGNNGIDYMTVLVIVEVILLVIIFSKLAYDVRNYNQTGELPWIARHICLGYSYSGMKSGNHWNNQDEQDYSEDPENSIQDSRNTFGYGGLLGCLYRTSSSLNSSESSNGANSRLQHTCSFRPRRHTNSTSGSVSKKSSSITNNANKQNKQNDLELIERCSSSARSARSSCKSSMSSTQEEVSIQQPRPKKMSIVERCSSLRVGKSSSMSNDETTQPRMKKISTDVAAQFRKDILDPANEEKIQEQPLIHQTDTETGNIRKISRLQRSLSDDATTVVTL